MRAAFAAWALGQEKRDLLAAHLDRLEALARRMEIRAEGGEESALSARRVRIEARDARASLAAAEADVSRSHSEVLMWNPGVKLKRPTRPDLPTPPTALGVGGRRDLEAQRFEVEQSRVEEKLSGRFVRFPDLLVGWRTIRDRDIEIDGPVLGFAWSVPLFDRRQADGLQAKGKLRVAEARLAFATQRAEADLAAAGAAYRRLRTEALEMAAGTENLGRMVEGAVVLYELGESGITDVLDTLRSVVSTELSELELLAAALEAHRDLEAAIGLPLLEGVSP
jgi:outer membrane protein TolC